MLKRLIAWMLASMLGLAYAGSALAAFHLWRINEIYSNATGTVQFIEMTCTAALGCNDGERFPSPAYTITVTPSSGSTFAFPSSTLPSAINKTLLIATPGFAAIAGVTPDYTIPAGFIAVSGGTMQFSGGDSVTYTALPGGTLSINRLGVSGTATPQNFAGVIGSIPAADTQAPTVPAGLSATAVSSTQINLSWTASTDNTAVTAYRVSRGGTFLTTVNAPAVTHGDTGLTPSTNYSYTVAACDAAGNCSVPSTAASATTQAPPDTQAPSVPAGVTATATGSSAINLSWNEATDNVRVTQYKIYRNSVLVYAPTLTEDSTLCASIPPACIPRSSTYTIADGVIPYLLGSLAGSTLYTYTVQACDAAGNCSAQSSPASATTLAAGMVVGPSARTQFEGFRDGATADTFVDFNSFAAGTALTTQVPGVTFQSNIDTAGNPFGPLSVRVSSAPQCTIRCIVGTPDNFGDDGRVGYQILFATPQRRAGLQRNWNSQTVTRFYNASDQLLGEYVGTGFVGFIANSSNSATDWVKRIQIDTVAPSTSRQVGYSDDLFFGAAQASSTYTPALEPGFNLIGNSLNLTLDVAATFGNQGAPVAGITSNTVSIWKWNAVDGRWAFYSPQLTVAGIASFAASKGYEVLATINPGEGYWVNAISSMTLPVQTGTNFNWNGFNFTALPSGFNLIATADGLTPSQFNSQVSETSPAPGVIPTTNFVSLWAWDAAAANWYFYSPLLESAGGLAAVKSYADGKFYRHFQDHGKLLGLGVGFWVNKP